MAAVVILALIAVVAAHTYQSEDTVVGTDSGSAAIEAPRVTDSDEPHGYVRVVDGDDVLPCPPAGVTPLERDLTVAYRQRTYLLPSGGVCRPGERVILESGDAAHP